MQFKAPNQPSSLNSDIQTDTFAAGLEDIHQTLRKNWQEAQASQTKYTSGKEVFQGWREGLAFNSALPDYKSIKDVGLQMNRTVHGK